MSGTRYHVARQPTVVSTNKGDDVPVAKKAIGEIQPKDMEDLPVAKEATREPS